MELTWIIPYLDDYRQIGTFLGSFFFGEAFIIATSFLALERSWPLSEVFVTAFLGVTLADLMWFLGGRYLLSKSRYLQRLKAKHNATFEKFERQSRSRKVVSMIFFKFLYGMRVVTLLYLSAHKMAFWKFFLVDIFGSIVWLLALFSIGWAAWSGFDYAIRAFHRLGFLLIGAIVFIVLIRYCEKWLRNRYTKK